MRNQRKAPWFLLDRPNANRFTGPDKARKMPTSTVPEPRCRGEGMCGRDAAFHRLEGSPPDLGRPGSIFHGKMRVSDPQNPYFYG